MKSWRAPGICSNWRTERKEQKPHQCKTQSRSSWGQGDRALALPGFICWFWGTRKPSPFPHPQPSPDARPREIAGRTAVDLKQVQALFTASNWDSLWIFPWAEEPQATAGGRNNHTTDGSQGKDWGESPWLLQVKLNPGLNKTPQPTDSSTQVFKISNNNNK